MNRYKNRLVRRAVSLLIALAGCGGEGSTSPVPAVARTGQALDTVPGGYDLSYDAAGRLVSVSAASGETAQYVYDPAGNLLEVRRIVSGTVSVMGFSPLQGDVGQLVTLFGAGFNPAPSQNVVQLNGTTVTILSATSTQLTFAVPAGATTGKIAVTTGGNTGTSIDDFTVTIAGDLLAITDFTPKFGPTGTVITIFGAGFLPDPLMDSVFIGGEGVALTSASPTSLEVMAGRYSGKVSVSVFIPFSTATSVDEFVVLPGTYAAEDIASIGRTSIGTPNTITIDTPGRAALLLFDGTQGQYLSLYVSAVTFAGDTEVSVYKPDGNYLFSEFVSNGGSDKFELGDLGQLPVSGTYTIAIKPSSTSIGSLALQILEDAVGALVPGEPPEMMALVAGQNGRYTMAGNANDYLDLSVTSLTTDPSGGHVSLNLYDPYGGILWSSGLSSAPASWQLPRLPISGTYTLQVLPSGTSGASLAVKLAQSLAGTTLALDGSATQFETTGQAGRFTFAGTAGQGWTMQATAGSTFTSSIQLSVYRPDGYYLTGATLYAGSDVKVDLGILPETGTYAVELVPNGVDTGTVSLRLVSEATGTLTTGAAPAAITLGTAQNGRYGMAGNAGDYLGLSVTSLPSDGVVSIDLYSPDGTHLWGTSFAGARFNFQLPQLPTSGNYTLRILPFGTSGASLAVKLAQSLLGTLALDGSATLFQTTGQAGRFSFTGAAGQGWTMQATAGSTFTSDIELSVYQPNGNYYAGTTLSKNSDVKLSLGLLPETGTYTVVIVPNGVDTGMVSLRLVAEATGTLTVEGATSSIALGTAQNGRLTFTGDAGDYLGLAMTALTTNPSGGYVSLYIYKPDGSQFSSYSASSAPVSWQLPQLPISGTYTLLVMPSGTRAATLAVKLARSLLGTLPSDGSTTQFQTTGQPGRFTFTGTAGQGWTMQAAAGSTFTSNIALSVYRPNGNYYTGTTLSKNSDVKLDLGILPATGTYTVVVVPNGVDTGTVSLRLVGEATGTLTVDSAPSTVVLGAAQNGRYTFTGNSGDYLGLAATALATSPSGGYVALNLYKPDGSYFSAYSPSSAPVSWQLPKLPISGTYTLRVMPSGTRAATLAVKLARSLLGTLPSDGSTTQFQTTGQPGRFTFTGTAGQGWTMQATAGSTFTSSIGLYVYQPNGNYYAGNTLFKNSDVKLDLGILPATGTYAVVVVPNGVDAGTVSLRLVSENAGTLTVGGGPATITLGTAQNGRYTFAGSGGDLLSLAVTSLTTSPSGGYVSLYLYSPGGSYLWGSGLSGASGSWQLPQLPTSGNYTLRVQPSGPSGATLNVQLSTR